MRLSTVRQQQIKFNQVEEWACGVAVGCRQHAHVSIKVCEQHLRAGMVSVNPRSLYAHCRRNWAKDRSGVRLQAAIASLRRWSVQVRRRAAALLELLPAAAGAWLVAAHLGLKRLGYRSFVDGLAQWQPVRVHRDDAPGDLKRQLSTLSRRAGEFVLLGSKVVLTKEPDRAVPGLALRGLQQRLPSPAPFLPTPARSIAGRCRADRPPGRR
jgi:hypothetical protein